MQIVFHKKLNIFSIKLVNCFSLNFTQGIKAS